MKTSVIRGLKPDAAVHIQRAGGFFRARYRGRRNCVIGATREEALKRLRDASTIFVSDSPGNTQVAERTRLYGYRGKA